MYLLCIHIPHPLYCMDNGELSINLRMLLNQWMVIPPTYTMYPYRAWGSSKAVDKYPIS